ncbi:MAG TPA: DUF1294 domain-containing protein, partial [Opitutaceae bacterium]|nr:DUF1294 domain-containing protein [Opitutaceae bacterium]
MERIPIYLVVIGYYVATTVITFMLYAWDKRAARKNGWRVRESTLLLWTGIGGFVGALIGQVGLRHKTQHRVIVTVTWLAAVLHMAAW